VSEPQEGGGGGKEGGREVGHDFFPPAKEKRKKKERGGEVRRPSLEKFLRFEKEEGEREKGGEKKTVPSTQQGIWVFGGGKKEGGRERRPFSLNYLQKNFADVVKGGGGGGENRSRKRGGGRGRKKRKRGKKNQASPPGNGRKGRKGHSYLRFSLQGKGKKKKNSGLAISLEGRGGSPFLDGLNKKKRKKRRKKGRSCLNFLPKPSMKREGGKEKGEEARNVYNYSFFPENDFGVNGEKEKGGGVFFFFFASKP